MTVFTRHFLSIADHSPQFLREVLDLAIKQKKQQQAGTLERSHVGRVLACIFHKPSLRTRVSFEVAMHSLGGTSLYLTDKELGIGSREAPEDVGRVLSRYLDGVMIRTFDQEMVEFLAVNSTIPVINGLTDLLHPCQVMADLQTVIEHRGSLDGLRVVFVGDGNNMVRSWINASAKFGFDFTLARPEGYGVDPEFVKAAYAGGEVRYRETSDPAEAVTRADVVYTDVWTSMGQEAEKQKRRRDFQGFQVNAELMSKAPSNAIILHCLPAHRDEEITHEAIESEQSKVFDQAENRLHAQRAILSLLIPPRKGDAA
jgi:ornithine carbamoyltransferase